MDWNEDYLLEWVNEIFATDIAYYLDTRDVECDYETDSDDRNGFECGEDDFD